jgi:hypothetical protein
VFYFYGERRNEEEPNCLPINLWMVLSEMIVYEESISLVFSQQNHKYRDDFSPIYIILIESEKTKKGHSSSIIVRIIIDGCIEFES